MVWLPLSSQHSQNYKNWKVQHHLHITAELGVGSLLGQKPQVLKQNHQKPPNKSSEAVKFQIVRSKEVPCLPFRERRHPRPVREGTPEASVGAEPLPLLPWGFAQGGMVPTG